MINKAYVALSWLLYCTAEYYSFYIDKTCMWNDWVNLQIYSGKITLGSDYMCI